MEGNTADAPTSTSATQAQEVVEQAAEHTTVVQAAIAQETTTQEAVKIPIPEKVCGIRCPWDHPTKFRWLMLNPLHRSLIQEL